MLYKCEVEYIVIVMCACQVAWLDNLLIELNLKHDVGTKLFIDNKSTINLSKNLVTHDKSKHICSDTSNIVTHHLGVEVKDNLYMLNQVCSKL